MADTASVPEIADELYGLAPEEFIARRTIWEKQLKAGGDAESAARVRAMTKPNAVGWLANQLVREHSDELGPLIELGAAMREATKNLSGEQLRELTAQQRKLVQVLVAQARALAAAADRRVSEENVRGLEATLHAALADHRAAEELLRGHLTQQLKRSGLGDDDLSEGAESARPTLKLVPSPVANLGKRRAADATRSRARAAIDQAENDVAEAGEARNLARTDVDESIRQSAELTATIAKLQDDLAVAIAQQRQVEKGHKRLQTRLDRLENGANSAERRLTQARRAFERERRPPAEN